MLCRDFMHQPPTHVRQSATLEEAIELMFDRHIQPLLVTDDEDRFVGEIQSLQFAKLLLPASVGLAFGVHNTDDLGKSVADLNERLKPHLSRPIREFIDHDIPVVLEKAPLIDALMLLRGGVVRVPVLDAPGGKLIGAISMLTILRTVMGK